MYPLHYCRFLLPVLLLNSLGYVLLNLIINIRRKLALRPKENAREKE